MSRVDFNNIQSFILVARERSFTRAAAKLGVSQSALSHAMRGLEERMGIRLLTRTTRGVAPTEAGELLINRVGAHFDGIESELGALSLQPSAPTGTVRITTHDHAASTILWPRIGPLIRANPGIKLEVAIDYGFINIVEERFDAGIRQGDKVAKDMIAVRLSAPSRMLVVGSPDYFARHGKPAVPGDLDRHNCICLRLPTLGSVHAWEFEKGTQKSKVHVKGQLLFSTTPQKLPAALEGFGLTMLPEDMVADYIAAGQLISVLDEYASPLPGYHLYYPNRRHPSPVFTMVVDALRYQGDQKK